MSVASMIKKKLAAAPRTGFQSFSIPTFETEVIDWDYLVTLDFETYYDADYTLSKMSTSEYVRDPRFKVQMLGIKIGNKPKRIITGAHNIAVALNSVPWKLYSLLCHNTAFDAFILSHHYKIQPKRRYCTMSMARGLHSNEIGAGLDEVSRFYGRDGKIQGALETTKGVLNWDRALIATVGEYCGVDLEECLAIFKEMVPKYPKPEMDLIDLTVRMFTDPVLLVDLPRVQVELEREVAQRKQRMLDILKLVDTSDTTLLKGKAEKALYGEERDLLMAKRAVGSNERFADMLRKAGVTEIPRKVSRAWMMKPVMERKDEDKYAYAFAKDDRAFIELPETPELWTKDLDTKAKKSAAVVAIRAAVVRALIEARLAVKSTTNITRAERFLAAGAGGLPLPVGYAYARAHTLRWGGNNKMNMQNLTRGGELRKSILAKKGHRICVADSGQIEARVNGWLWDQDDLLDAFAKADKWDKKTMGVAHGANLDAYCRFASEVYSREITTDDSMERFVGKVCVLGLGFQMGAPKLQMTLAKGALGGPPVFFSLEECQVIVNKYRAKNHRIAAGWKMCAQIIEDMAIGRQGSWKCLSWDKGVLYLPNGLTLKYPELRKSKNEDTGYDEWTYLSGEVRKKIYGGLLCENIVQALARLIVAEQMLKIDAKYRVVMMTHDEVVAMVKAALADKALAFMIACMRVAPKWCSTIPLNAEGGHDVNYSK